MEDNTAPAIEGVDVQKLVKNIPPAKVSGHVWRQHGTELRCEACEFAHSTFIPVGYQMYGEKEDGTPMLRKIVVH